MYLLSDRICVPRDIEVQEARGNPVSLAICGHAQATTQSGKMEESVLSCYLLVHIPSSAS